LSTPHETSRRAPTAALSPPHQHFALACGGGQWYHNIGGKAPGGLKVRVGNMSEEILDSNARGFKMNKSANLIMALGLCLFCMTSVQAQRLPDPNLPQDSGVQMTLTHLSVNGQTLDLGWTITNNSDHEVWICDSINKGPPSVFEWFLDKDARTLVIRRRFGLPASYIPQERINPAGRYVRLGAGQEKAESLSIALPVKPQRLFPGESGNAEYAERLALEIGFYDESLPALILEIVELAEHFNIDLGVGSYGFRDDVRYRFFGGPIIAALFKSNLQGFAVNVSSADASGEMWMFHMDEIDMGEKVLRIEVDGVSIPYKSNYPPLVQTGPSSGVTAALTKLDVNDTNLELSYKIKNNTDHDVWVCNGYDRDDGIRYFDRFMATDDKTLVLRRRYNLLSAALVERFPSPFHYLRLRPGQEKVESHSFTLPVTSTSPVFHTLAGGLNAKSAQRLAIEIGFYDEDLRALILGVVDMAERIGYDDSALSAVTSSGPLSLYYRFFGGFKIARLFKTENITYFRDSVMSDGDEILTPPMHQSLNGEQVLRIEVENLSIPFRIL
jgi:hypothetical protein